MNSAPVFIVDNDRDELDIIEEIWKELDFENALELFSNPQDLIRRLNQTINPFIIICDVNLHNLDGFTLRQKLSEETALSYKSIPFVFWSTTASNDQIKTAYDLGGHGFFLKGGNYKEIKESLTTIMTYWKASKAPTLPAALAGQIKNASN